MTYLQVSMMFIKILERKTQKILVEKKNQETQQISLKEKHIGKDKPDQSMGKILPSTHQRSNTACYKL